MNIDNELLLIGCEKKHMVFSDKSKFHYQLNLSPIVHKILKKHDYKLIKKWIDFKPRTYHIIYEGLIVIQHA